MKKVEIYVATHKRFNTINDDMYIPMQGGASLYGDCFGYSLDNVGDNISEKKEFYNELTTLYWMWKNSNSDIVGLCHYRRYFSRSQTSYNIKYILKKDAIIKILDKYDIILPEEDIHFGRDNWDYTLGCVRKKDLLLVKEVIEQDYPEYMKAFNEFMKSDSASFCNMLILNKEKMNEYCEWLFDILFKVESKIDMTGYSKQEIRFFGFIAERLLNVWVKANGLKVYYTPMLITGKSKNQKYFIKRFTEIIGIYDSLKRIKSKYKKINNIVKNRKKF